MAKFTILGGWIGGFDSTGNVEIEAETAEKACERYVELVDDGSLPTHYHSYDPGPTFVEFLNAEDGNDLPVPREYQEHGDRLEERDKHLGAIEGLLDCYLRALEAAGMAIDRWLKHPSVHKPVEILASHYGEDDKILIRFYDDATFGGPCDGFMTLGAFFRANKDGFDEDRLIMIREELKAMGRVTGNEGAGGTWRIEAVW